MELRHLESFLALAEVLHFGRAAEQVNLSQPALSRQIQQLEHELGARLLDRSARAVSLTAAGRALRGHAERVFDELREARLAIARASDQPGGHLAIACFDSASVYLAPELLARLDAAYPSVSMSIATLGTREALRAVRHGTVEAALVTLPVALEGLRLLPLYREQLLAALPRDHPLGAEQEITMEALSAERLVTFLTGQNNTRMLIDRAFEQARRVPAAIIELESVQAIKDAVRAGLGLAIVGETVVAHRTGEPGLLVRPLRPALYRDIGMVSRAGAAEHPLVLAVGRLLGEVAASLGLAELPDGPRVEDRQR